MFNFFSSVVPYYVFLKIVNHSTRLISSSCSRDDMGFISTARDVILSYQHVDALGIFKWPALLRMSNLSFQSNVVSSQTHKLKNYNFFHHILSKLCLKYHLNWFRWRVPMRTSTPYSSWTTDTPRRPD